MAELSERGAEALIARQANRVLNTSLAIVWSLLVGCFLTEFALRLLGSPSGSVVPLAHPAATTSLRRSIEFEYQRTTNSAGLRYAEIPWKKPAAEWRIFVVGDSFVEGVGVGRKETFTNRLEARLSSPAESVRFINGGLSGTGPLQYARLFLHVGRRYNADALLICLFANDVTNTDPTARTESVINLESSPPTGARYWLRAFFPRILFGLRLGRERWRGNSDPIERVADEARRRGLSETLIEAWRRRLPQDLANAVRRDEFNGSILASGLLHPDYWLESLDLSTARSKQSVQKVLSLLDLMATRARGDRARVGVVFIPTVFQYDPDAHNPRIRNAWREAGVSIRKEWLSEEAAVEGRLEEWARRQGLPFLSLTPGLREARARRPPLTYLLDQHWTPSGHAVAAELLEPWLVAVGLVPTPGLSAALPTSAVEGLPRR